MDEDKEKTKPKATLIKHRKTEPVNRIPTDEPVHSDAKKVVVVKKKVVVKMTTKSIPASAREKQVSSSEKSGKTTELDSETSRIPTKAQDSKNEKAVSSTEVSEKSGHRPSDTQTEKSSIGTRVGRRSTENRSSSTDEGRDDEGSSSERITSGKDTVASPPKRIGTSGVQVLETRRTGGRAGVVAGRRVDTGSNRRAGGRAGQFGARQSGGLFRGSTSPVSSGGLEKYHRKPEVSGRSGGYIRSPGGQGASSGSRPGGRFSPGKSGGFGSAPTSPPPVSRSKKFYKAKKTYEKRKEEQEKLYQYARKKQVVQANPVPKEIEIMEVIAVSELARKMNLKASDLISKLMGMGMMVSINQQIDAETATILADDYDCKVKIVSLYEETIIESDIDHVDEMKQRPPVVTVMGHVDHGKTKLLDTIRSTDVASGEHGGITQHIGAYMVHTPKGNITFLDTPGHSAFTMMRARGAQVTDLVVLVVAANDGVMPQTVEAIQHAKEAKSPIVVAINKMDLPEANPEKVKQQLSEYELLPEDWGGSTQFIEISALKGEGISDLLNVLILESEMLELKANWDRRADGKIIESRVDQGRGIVSTVLVEKGTLRIGDAFVAGIFHGKVRAMFDDKGMPLQEATPSMPVEILGFSGVPDAGDPFQVIESEREARQYGSKRQELRKMETAKNVKKITLDNLYDSIQEGNVQEIKIIIKGDVHGSVEALQSALEKLSTEEIRLICIRAAAGAIIEDDVNLALASEAIIVGFHVRPTAKAQTIAEREKVEIRKYNVIYDAVEDIKAAMEGMLAPEFEEESTGEVEIREIFKVPKIGTVAGCMVISGSITRKSHIHLIRDNTVLYTGALASLKRFKEDIKEVKEGFECGVGLENYSDIQVGDTLEVFTMKEIAKKLGKAKADE